MPTWTDDFERQDLGRNAPNGSVYTQWQQRPDTAFWQYEPAAWAITGDGNLYATSPQYQPGESASLLLIDTTETDADLETVIDGYGTNPAVIIRANATNLTTTNGEFMMIQYHNTSAGDSVFTIIKQQPGNTQQWDQVTLTGITNTRTLRVTAVGNLYTIYVDNNFLWSGPDDDHLYDTNTWNGLYAPLNLAGFASLTYTAPYFPPLPLIDGHPDAPVGISEMPLGDVVYRPVAILTEDGRAITDEQDSVLVGEGID